MSETLDKILQLLEFLLVLRSVVKLQ